MKALFAGSDFIEKRFDCAFHKTFSEKGFKLELVAIRLVDIEVLDQGSQYHD